MASAMAVTVNAPATSNGRRVAPRLLCRGRMRRRVKKLLKAAEQALAADVTENARATEKGYDPYLFVDTRNSSIETALKKVINQAYGVLTDKG